MQDSFRGRKHYPTQNVLAVLDFDPKFTWALFVSASGSFWPPKAAADCQTPSFLASFYKIRWDKNHSKST
jgi:hypothetical protein